VVPAARAIVDEWAVVRGLMVAALWGLENGVGGGEGIGGGGAGGGGGGGYGG
jgi:hypothetical protein